MKDMHKQHKLKLSVPMGASQILGNRDKPGGPRGASPRIPPVLPKFWVAPILIITLLAIALFAAAPARAQSPCGDSVTVVYGDTLRDIAARCETTVPAVVAANPQLTNPDFITVGQQLNMPDEPAQAPESGRLYTVKRGDTLRRIAARFDTTVSALVTANPTLPNPDLIYPGQKLLVPGQQPGPATAAISPASGPPGTEVQVSATGFPPEARVEIGLGRWRSEYDVTGAAQTNAGGDLNTQATIPEFAEANERWVVVVETAGGQRDDLKAVSNTFTVTEGPQGAPVFEQVDVYLTAIGQGEIGCNDAMVPVERDVAPTRAPLTAAIRELLSLEERTYGQSGLYNVLHRSDLRIEDITLAEGKATIRLAGDYQVGGVCDDPRVEAQLERTALQFSTVDRVEIFINGRPLEELTSGK